MTPGGVLRWSYALGSARWHCEVTLDADHRLYELRLAETGTSRVRIEYFAFISQALIQQCEFESRLLGEGYSLETFETGAAAIVPPAGATMSTPPHVVIVNSSPDTCEMLQNYFRMQGWAASVVPARMVRDGSITPEALIAGHHPDAILFDVALPYEENWSALQALRNSPHVTCPIVVTTTNEAIVRRLTGTEESILEVVGKPYDLEQLFSSVNAAVHGEGPAHPRDVPDRRVADRRVGERRSSSHRTDPSTSDDSGRDSSRVVPWMRGAKRHIG